MSSTVTVMATFAPKQSVVEDFIALMTSMVEISRQEPGCLRYDFYQDDGGHFYMLEGYRDSAAVEAHRDTDHYANYRAAVADMLEDPISVVVLRAVPVR